MDILDYHSRIKALGGTQRILSKQETWKAMQSWREVFAIDYYSASGKWKNGKYDWHVFSFGYTPCISGEKALHSYLKQPTAAYYLVPDESERLPGYWISGTNWPDLQCWLLDLYVWPDDLSWTIAFTHESVGGFGGPYFAQRPGRV